MVGQPRSTQRLPSPIPSDEEQALRAFLRDFSRRRPRWGWRRAATAARKAGWMVNNKRIHRLWRAEGLRVSYRKRKKPLRGSGVAVGAFSPIRPNVVWGRNQMVIATSPDLGVLCDDHSPKFAGGSRCSDRGRGRRCQLPGGTRDDGRSGVDSAVQRPAVGGRSQVRASLGPQAPSRSLHRTCTRSPLGGGDPARGGEDGRDRDIHPWPVFARRPCRDVTRTRTTCWRSGPVRARRDQGRDRSWRIRRGHCGADRTPPLNGLAGDHSQRRAKALPSGTCRRASGPCGPAPQGRLDRRAIVALD